MHSTREEAVVEFGLCVKLVLMYNIVKKHKYLEIAVRHYHCHADIMLDFGLYLSIMPTTQCQ